MSCEAPETGHKEWVKKQGAEINQGPAIAFSMAQHTVRKEASALLCEAVQGAFVEYYAYFTYYMFLCNVHIRRIYKILHILLILHIYCIVTRFWLPARVDDEDPDLSDDDWFVMDKRLGQEVRVRADRWYQSDPSEALQEKVCPDNRCNIWERAKVRRDMTHSLTSGSSHNIGYDAFQWESILHGDAGHYGKYSVLQVLPDKIGRFLFEYNSELYSSLNLPYLPADRSDVDVHRLLKQEQVCNRKFCIFYIFMHCIHICIYC